MTAAPLARTLDFEVYLLVTMKYGMINQDAEREAKLAEHGLSFQDAERIHGEVSELLANESTQFENLRTLVGVGEPGATSLTFNGILWKDFDFTATANESGSIRSAGYQRARGRALVATSPSEQAPWTMDLTDFTQHYGPLALTSTAPLFDEYLPAQELHKFEWDGREYGAGFGWGLFLSAAMMWT